MDEKLVSLDEFNMSDEELFSKVDHDTLESERITAPRYSYWQSVFRVFFKKKINIIMLSVLAVIILFTYIYPIIIGYDVNVDPYENLSDPFGKHLTPSQAIDKYGFSLKWLFGAGSAGESTFNAVWYGSSISISLALVCAAINMTVGVIIGSIWGFSKKVDIFMTEVYNIVANIPYKLITPILHKKRTLD